MHLTVRFMNTEICRAITFINYHIPVQKINEDEIEYSAIGFFDGMKTEAISLKFAEDDFKPLWKHTMHNMKMNAGHYSYQNIFAFSNDEWNDHSDDEFWNEEQNKSFPLTFVVFLQLQNYEIGNRSIAESCIQFSNVASSVLEGDGMSYTYYTIDKNDFVVCIKCLHYSKAVEAIKALHNIGKTVIYSYSVFTISNKVLAELSEKKYPEVYRQIIDSISLKGITNSIDSGRSIALDRKYCELCTRLVEALYGTDVYDNELYDILGDDDFRFIARKVNLGRLLAQFSKGGLLCYSEKELQFFLFSSNLVINTKTPNYIEFKDSDKRITKEEFSCVIEDMCNWQSSPKCDELLKTLNTIISNNLRQTDFEGKEEVASYLYAIWQLLQSLKALEMAPTKKYDFWSLYHPLSMMISILSEKTNFSNNKLLHEFIHKISMTLHGTLRTDIQFFQIKDFNVIVHYAPSKLRAFYSLWAIKVKDFYSQLYTADCDRDEYQDGLLHQYSFVFSPGMFKEVSVKQLYESYDEKKRLMLITSPERYLYLLHWTPLILAHEVSHYVGSQVRSRAKRHEIWLKCSARVLTLEMESFRYKSIKSDTTGYNLCNCLEKAIAVSKFYKELINQLKDDEEHVRCKEKRVAHPYHSSNSKKIIMSTLRRTVHTDIAHLISSDSGNLLEAMEKQIGFENMPFDEKIKLGESLQKITYGLDDNLRVFVSKFQADVLSQLLDVFRYLTVESHADLMVVLTLEISPERYLRSFTDSSVLGDIDGGKEKLNDTLMVRVSLVIETIRTIIEKKKDAFANSDFVKLWSGDVTRNLTATISLGEAAGKLAALVYPYCESCRATDKMTEIRKYGELYNRSERAFSNKEFHFLNDKIIWELLNEYLQSCAEEYLKIINGNEKLSRMQKKLKEFYAAVTGESILGMVQKIEEFLSDFENGVG